MGIIYINKKKPRWSRNTTGTQLMMRKKSQKDALQSLQRPETVAHQAESSFSLPVDSEERELSASSNSSLGFLPLLDLTRPTVSQSKESIEPIPCPPAPRSTLPVSTSLPSLMRLSKRRSQPRKLDPTSSSLNTPQRLPAPLPERHYKRILTPPSSRTSKTRWSSDISALDSPSPATTLHMP